MPNQWFILPIPSWSEGRRPSSRTLGGERWTPVCAETMAWTGVRQKRVVLAPVAGVKPPDSQKLAGSDGVNQELVSGESTI